MKDAHKGSIMKSYVQIEQELKKAYNKGARFVDFEGGEPTLWREGNLTLNDLYVLAKKIGYFTCTLTTNGQNSFEGTLADSVWVSVDGYRNIHDKIRGEKAFEKLDISIRESKHKEININMAINSINKDSVKDTIEYAKMHPNIKMISLNFHTPYPGTEHLMLNWDERCKVIDEILEYKKNRYPIMNSKSGLKTMKKRNFKKYCWISSFILIDGLYLDECPGKTLDICSNCGFCMAGEMHSLMHFKPDTVLSGMKLRGSR
jgi:MoaA/NifB/PqqE/SkfB family radical SAM enzyme